MSIDWPWTGRFRSNGGASEAPRRLLEAFRDAGESLASKRAARHVRAIKDELLAAGDRATRSTRGLVESRPLEALLLVGVGAFTLGWLARRMRESARSTVASRSPRKRTAPAAQRARTAPARRRPDGHGS